jgi:formate hydrogenlyase subunit 4
MFVFTLILGAIAFAATAIEFPGIMRQLIDWAQQLPPYLEGLGLSNNYLVWTDIILSGDKLVLLGFVLATRIVLALIGTVLGPIFGVGSKRSRDESAFEKWG